MNLITFDFLCFLFIINLLKICLDNFNQIKKIDSKFEDKKFIITVDFFFLMLYTILTMKKLKLLFFLLQIKLQKNFTAVFKFHILYVITYFFNPILKMFILNFSKKNYISIHNKKM